MTTGRNDPCPCGSGKKYKKCCQGKYEFRPPITPSGKQDTARLIENAMAHLNAGSLAQAEALCRLALQAEPRNSEALNLSGLIAQRLGRFDEAESRLRQAIDADGRVADYHNNLGNLFNSAGRPEDAERCFRKTLQLVLQSPGQAGIVEVYNNLGSSLHWQGRLCEAIASYRSALQLNPAQPVVLSNLAASLLANGEFDEAEANCRRALEISPNHCDALLNLGKALCDRERYAEAVEFYRRAIRIEPGFAMARNNLGNALKWQGNLIDALDAYRAAIAAKPDFSDAWSNYLLALNYSSGHGAAEIFDEHLRFARQFEAPLMAAWREHGNDRDPTRKLKIGYVSADFRKHALAHFIEQVLGNHDRDQFEIHCYYNNLISDEATGRFKSLACRWREIGTLSDEAVAQLIREDGIDILIDLSGHTGANRLQTFARKPAPIQASWMGYPGTTGLQAMDYYLGDRFFLPPGKFEGQFTEKIALLPANAPFSPAEASPAVNALPALKNGYPTFGSFNAPGKITREVVALWAKLLRALPESRMLLGAMPADGNHGKLGEWFAEEGIESSRLDFHPRTAMDGYLKLHHQVDFCLDTFPYAGGTTTLHALWMGVPTLTLAGTTPAGRQGAAILGHVGLEAFVAHDPEQFLRIGLSFSERLGELSIIRSELRERFAESALARPKLVASALERALRIMWQRFCDGLAPAALDVTAIE